MGNEISSKMKSNEFRASNRDVLQPGGCGVEYIIYDRGLIPIVVVPGEEYGIRP